MVSLKSNSIVFLVALYLSAIASVEVGFGQTKTATQHQNFDRVYGLNPDLYNGRKYYRDNYGALGHPYWVGEKSLPATLVSGSKTYARLTMKYELHKQFFILEFTDNNNAVQMLILNDYAIDTIYLNNAVFVRNHFIEIDNKYIQLIYSGKYSAYLSRTKQFQYQSVGVQTGHKYSEEMKEFFLVQENEVHKFRNKRSFLEVFPKASRKTIKEFISAQGIKFRKLTDVKLMELVAYCNEAVK